MICILTSAAIMAMFIPTLKDLLGYASIAICLVQYGPLIYLTFIGKKKPHVITRVIWTITFGITYAAQYIDRGGAGSWATGFSALCCVVIACAAMRNDKSYITRSDWVLFCGVLLAIPVWVLTHNPLYAALWVTAIDMLAYVPTFRKSWHSPHDELISSFSIGSLKQLMGLLALEHYSLTTMVFPVAILIADIGVIGVLYFRRRVYKTP